MLDECENDSSFRKDSLISDLKFKVRHQFQALKLIKAEKGDKIETLEHNVISLE